MSNMSNPVKSAGYTRLTVSEIATDLGVHRRVVYAEIKRGHLPAIRPGGMYRIDPGDYAAYLARCQVIPTS